MRTTSFALLATLGALAAGAPLAAKPPPVDSSDPRQIYRGRGISVCVAEMRTIPKLAPGDLEALCGCAFDRFMPTWPTGALPPLDHGLSPPAARSALLDCATEEDARLAGAVASRLAELPQAPSTATQQASAPGVRVRAWLDGLSLPGWLARLPIWAWLPIGLLVLVLIRALFRRRESGRDLIGPPAHMRRGAWLGRRPGR